MNTKLFVRNLALQTTEAELRTAFEAFGAVTTVELASDRYTGRPRGFAFVTMGTTEESTLSTGKLNGTDLNGRPLAISEARGPGEEVVGHRVFTSPNRKAGAFHARGKRRH